MGHGYTYICNKCGYEISGYYGIGLAFLSEHLNIRENARHGIYGPTVVKYAQEGNALIYDQYRGLFLCSQCGHLEQGSSLIISTSDSKEIIYKSYPHCKKCKIQLQQMDECSAIHCPHCQEYMDIFDIFDWD